MHVFVAGATGVLGRVLIPRFIEAGHNVTGLARTPEKLLAVQTLNANPVRGDILDATRAYLGSHARVYGDITAENLTVCEGAYFSGNVKMTARRAAESSPTA